MENRLTYLPTAAQPSWAYDPAGKRVLQSPAYCSNDQKFVQLYGLDGRRLATYQMIYDSGSGTWSTYWYAQDLYFGGRLIKSGQSLNGVATDRLGSVRANNGGQRISYFPYGEERTTTADGQEKFGTYFRDSGTGMDYADQRYYSWAAEGGYVGRRRPHVRGDYTESIEEGSVMIAAKRTAGDVPGEKGASFRARK